MVWIRIDSGLKSEDGGVKGVPARRLSFPATQGVDEVTRSMVISKEIPSLACAVVSSFHMEQV